MLWLLLISLVVLVLLALVLGPVVFGRAEPWYVGEEGSAIKLLRKEKERVLRLLKDLDLELESGALEESEYKRLRDNHLREAALVNRRLEALGVSIERKSRSAVSDDGDPPAEEVGAGEKRGPVEGNAG